MQHTHTHKHTMYTHARVKRPSISPSHKAAFHGAIQASGIITLPTIPRHQAKKGCGPFNQKGLCLDSIGLAHQNDIPGPLETAHVANACAGPTITGCKCSVSLCTNIWYFVDAERSALYIAVCEAAVCLYLKGLRTYNGPDLYGRTNTSHLNMLARVRRRGKKTTRYPVWPAHSMERRSSPPLRSLCREHEQSTIDKKSII